MQKVINIQNGTTRMPAWRMAKPVDFELLKGEQLAIVGGNGSGKTMLVDIITGRHPLVGKGVEYDFSPNGKPLVADNIKYIAFRDSYGSADSTYYLQQRWNQHDIDESTPTVGRLLDEDYQLLGEDTGERQRYREHLYALFHIEPLLDKYIILLSSGEMRKFQLTRVLLSMPKVLILDNPFIGLDEETRLLLSNLLRTIIRESDLQIILVQTKMSDIPDFVTHIIKVENMVVGRKQTANEFFLDAKPAPESVLSKDMRQAVLSLAQKDGEFDGDDVVEMHNVGIRYGKRQILKDLTMHVLKGSSWALSGQNGAGKSTLLSLICADNPQSYACNIVLFGQKRGSGETIWDIKKHIGYVSPEMHRAYQKDIPSIKVVASGLKDAAGMYFKPSEEELEQCRFWMRVFGVDKLEERTFLKLSSGEQRLLLLARAFVKDPELIILDEPLHGLDDRNRRLVKDVIETFMKRKNKTMIMVCHYKEEFPDCITDRMFLVKHT